MGRCSLADPRRCSRPSHRTAGRRGRVSRPPEAGSPISRWSPFRTGISCEAEMRTNPICRMTSPGTPPSDCTAPLSRSPAATAGSPRLWRSYQSARFVQPGRKVRIGYANAIARTAILSTPSPRVAATNGVRAAAESRFELRARRRAAARVDRRSRVRLVRGTDEVDEGERFRARLLDALQRLAGRAPAIAPRPRRRSTSSRDTGAIRVMSWPVFRTTNTRMFLGDASGVSCSGADGALSRDRFESGKESEVLSTHIPWHS